MTPSARREHRRLLLARSQVLRTSLALQTRLLVLRGRQATSPAGIGAWLLSHPVASVALGLVLMRSRGAVGAAARILPWARLLAPLLVRKRPD